MTAQELIAALPPGHPTRVKLEAEIASAKANKYHAQKTLSDGIVFDSKREAKVWGDLSLMLEVGEVLAVVRQVTFKLAPGVSYRADFVVLFPDGRYEVWDAKGVRTKEYKIKAKLMAEKGVQILEK